MAKYVGKFFNNFRGLDLRSTDQNRSDDNATVMSNCQFARSGGIEKRTGFQARAESEGGHGLFTYNKVNQTTGAITQELISISDRAWRRKTATLTITYSGTGSADVTIQGDSSDSAVHCILEEDLVEIMDEDLGVGYDETTPVTLATLKTQIDLETNFAASISGTTTIPAAFLKFQKKTRIDNSTMTLDIEAYEWEQVDRTVSSGPFAGSETNKDDTGFENVSGANLNGCLYLGNGYDETQKYDGQTLYRAGCPQVSRPTLVETASGGGAAEVTDVTTRAEAGVAQITDVVCVIESSTKPATTLTCYSSDPTKYNPDNSDNIYFLLNTPSEIVAVWFSVTDLGAGHQNQPTVTVVTPDRYIQVDILSTDDNEGIGVKIRDVLEADSAYTASSGGTDDVVLVTCADYGPMVYFFNWNATKGAMSVLSTDFGSNGLHQTYFILKDEDGSVAFWYDLDTTGIEPSHGADRSVEITTVSRLDTANDVASATSTAVNADSKFSTSVVTVTVTVTNSSSEDVGSDVSNGTSGFTVTVTTAGGGSLHEKYFILYDGQDPDDDSVAFWYDVGGGGIEPSHGADRSVEITTVSASDTANTVASVTSTAVNADSAFSTSVSTNVVTVTAAASGDYPDGEAGDSGFTMDVTTQGADAGLGVSSGVWRYRLVAVQHDAAGNIVTGVPTAFDANGIDVESDALSDPANNIQLTIEGIQAESGYNTNCAIVNGAQNDVNTITVDSGHTMQDGDTAYFLDGTSGVNAFTTRSVTSTTSTTIVVDGNDVNVADNAVISNNLRIGIYRTLDAGTSPFLVAQVPNDSINGTFTYIDGTLDANLGAEFIEPIRPHTVPPKGRYLAAWNNQLIISGDPESVNTVYYSFIGADAQSSEYFPSAHSLVVESSFGDKITGICQNNEVFAVLKDRSVHTISGDIQSGNIRVDAATSGEHGCISHHTIAEVNGSCVFLDDDGVYAVSGGQLPVEVSIPIRSVFVGSQGFGLGSYALKRAVAFNDRVNDRYILFLPVETTDSSGNRYPTAESRVIVWDYFRNAWFQWTNINFAGGAAKVGDDIYLSERRFSGTTNDVEHILYQFNNSGTNVNTELSADYMDHVTAITSTYRSNWLTFGEPSFFKKWVKLKVFNSDAIEPDGYNLTVETERNYTPLVLSTDATLSFDISTNREYDKKLRLRPTKARNMRFGFKNAQDNKNVGISAYEVEVGLIQRPSDIKE